MLSECATCDRGAVSYWGRYAFCSGCLASEQLEHPDAHCCVSCGARQPTNVSWLRSSPCGACKAKGVIAVQPPETPRKPNGFRKVKKPRFPGELEARGAVD